MSQLIATSCFSDEVRFSLYTDASSFHAAAESCVSQGSTLARIDTVEEFEFVKNLAETVLETGELDAFWIGERLLLLMKNMT